MIDVADDEESAIRTRLPGPRGSWLLGSLPALRRQGYLRLLVDGWRRYGDLVRFQLGPATICLLAHPDHIRHVVVANRPNYRQDLSHRKLKTLLGLGLLTSEGELWQRQRRLMQPFFTAKAVAPFAETITSITADMLEGWQGYARSGAAIDVDAEMVQLMMRIIGKTMFSIDVGGEALELGHALNYALKFIIDRTITALDMPLWLPTADNRQFRAALRTIDHFVYRLIAERRVAEPQHDLLAMLQAARDTETGTGMSEQQLRDEVLTIFFAGHEASSLALTWTWYLLSLYPEVDRRLHAELARVLGGRVPTVSDLPALPYTRMVLEEAMRLYPPVPLFVRDAIADDTVGGYHIPAGSIVVMCQYITHRHPAFWRNPEGFDPERFSPEQSAPRPQYAYFPFGGGHRTCIGNNLAMLENQLILATVAQRYRLHLAPGQPIELVAKGTLRPRYGMEMTLDPR